MFGLSAGDLVIVVGILVLLFGSKMVSNLAHSVADAVKVLRASLSEDVTDQNDKE